VIGSWVVALRAYLILSLLEPYNLLPRMLASLTTVVILGHTILVYSFPSHRDIH
jgi:hypothetical protein